MIDLIGVKKPGTFSELRARPRDWDLIRASPSRPATSKKCATKGRTKDRTRSRVQKFRKSLQTELHPQKKVRRRSTAPHHHLVPNMTPMSMRHLSYWTDREWCFRPALRFTKTPPRHDPRTGRRNAHSRAAPQASSAATPPASWVARPQRGPPRSRTRRVASDHPG